MAKKQANNLKPAAKPQPVDAPEAVVMLTDSREGRRGAVVYGLSHFRLNALVQGGYARWAGPHDLARRKAGQLAEV